MIMHPQCDDCVLTAFMGLKTMPLCSAAKQDIRSAYSNNTVDSMTDGYRMRH